MDASTVLAKTAKGQEAVAQRAHGLDRKARQILIMIDGKREIAALPPLCDRSETLAIADRLLTDGMVALASNFAVADKVEPVELAAAPDLSDIEKARAFMVNTTHHFVGVFASGLVNRIERSSTVTELSDLRAEWRSTIASSGNGLSQIDKLDLELTGLFRS
jgi:hypothetical protein